MRLIPWLIGAGFLGRPGLAQSNGWDGATETSVRCFGSTINLGLQFAALDLIRPQLRFPYFVGVQELCAAPWGRFKGSFLTINAQCSSQVPGQILARPLAMKFDPSIYYVHQSMVNRYQQMQIFCRSRCFCTEDVRPGMPRPKGFPAESQTYVKQRNETQLISVQNLPNEDKEIRLFSSTSRDLVSAIKVQNFPANTFPGAFLTYHDRGFRSRLNDVLPTTDQYLSLHPENEILCDPTAPFPRIDLPLPYTYADFDSAQDLCAIQLSGGNPGANAGMYCSPFWRLGMDYTLEVRFKETLTPRTDWTTRGNVRFALRMQSYCQRVCRCPFVLMPPAGPPKLEHPTPLLMFLADGSAIVEGPEDTWQLGLPGNGGGFVTVSKEVWDAAGKSSDAESCGDIDDRESARPFCPDPWPTALLGPYPEESRKVVERRPSTNTCAATCTKQAECGKDCKCLVTPGTLRAGQRRGETMFPHAMCVEASVASGRRKWKALFAPAVLSSLSGRAVHEVACPCNVSYVSVSCCEAEDGQVWERRELKLGFIGDLL